MRAPGQRAGAALQESWFTPNLPPVAASSCDFLTRPPPPAADLPPAFRADGHRHECVVYPVGKSRPAVVGAKAPSRRAGHAVHVFVVGGKSVTFALAWGVSCRYETARANKRRPM